MFNWFAVQDIRAELDGDSPVYWVAIWSNPSVRNMLGAAELGGSQVTLQLETDSTISLLQVDGFLQEKEKLDREVNKWEDSNNDIGGFV